MIQLLFSLHRRIDRRTYFGVGLGLMLLKYAVDASVIRLATGQPWTPLDYLLPVVTWRGHALEALPGWVAVALVVWTLPFIWIGVSMTLRRAVDAGHSPWICLAFFVPVLNYLAMLVLSLLPSSPFVAWDDDLERVTAVDRLRSAVAGVAAALAVGLAAVGLLVFALDSYGTGLFLATPFVMGAVSAFVHNHGHPRSGGETTSVVMLGLALVGGSLVLFALEGVLCVAMAFPLGAAVAWFGGQVGRSIAIHSRAGWSNAAYALLLLPGAAAVDARAPRPTLREVVTSIEVDAPPERVWEQVIAFREIRERPSVAFRLGIAYPVRASIEGTGVGAVRRCEFSTGAFVEPITRWEPPYRLGFDVVEQPPVLQEWSPYRSVYAPHVDGFFRSTRGEFRLVPLAGGRTRLEGSTWYALDIHPLGYWAPITESLLHAIHRRVLEQVKRQAELPAPRTAARTNNP